MFLSSIMAREKCDHPVPPGLYDRLVSMRLYVCPLCMVHANVRVVKDAKAALASLPKIKAARDPSNETEAEWESQKENRYATRLLVRQWRRKKVGLHNALVALEQLQSKRAGERWNDHLDLALKFWDESRDECCQIPGYKFTGEESVTVDDSSSKSSLVKWSGDTVETFKSGRWQLVTTRGHNPKTRPSDNRVTKPSSFTKNTLRRAQATNKYSVLGTHEGTPSLTTTTPPAPYSPSHPPLLRSCIKRQRTSSNPDEEPRPPKKACIDGTVTVSASDLSPTHTFPTYTHSSYTTVEMKPRRSVRRKSRRYQHSSWTSTHPNGHINTSWTNTPPWVFASLQANIVKEESGDMKDVRECETCPDLCVEPVVYCGECLALQWHREREAEWQKREKEREKREKVKAKKIKKARKEKAEACKEKVNKEKATNQMANKEKANKPPKVEELSLSREIGAEMAPVSVPAQPVSSEPSSEEESQTPSSAPLRIGDLVNDDTGAAVRERCLQWVESQHWVFKYW